MPDKDIDKAKKLFIEKGLTYGAIASKLGITSRTVERWSSKGNWRSLRDSEEIISEAVATRISEELNEPVPPRVVRAKLSDCSDEQKLDDAIADITNNAYAADVKSKEAAYATQAKLIQAKQQLSMYAYDIELKQLQVEKERYEVELKRRQIYPPSIAALVDMAMTFNLDVAELMRQIRRRAEEIG